jgi:hypothetical protein
MEYDWDKNKAVANKIDKKAIGKLNKIIRT